MKRIRTPYLRRKGCHDTKLKLNLPRGERVRARHVSPHYVSLLPSPLSYARSRHIGQFRSASRAGAISENPHRFPTRPVDMIRMILERSRIEATRPRHTREMTSGRGPRRAVRSLFCVLRLL